MAETQNKTGKVALKAGFWYVVSNVVVKSIAVVTTPIFTRLMTTEEYGTVQTFVAWNALLVPVFSLNLAYSVGRAKLDFPDHLDDYLGSMQVLTALVSMVIALFTAIFIGPVSRLLDLSSLETACLIAYLFFGVAITLYQNGFRYRYKFKQNIAIAWYTALGTTTLSLSFIFLLDGNRADLRILGITLPTVALSLFFWFLSITKKRLNFNREYWKYGLQISLPLILHTISMHILSQSDRIFVTKIWGRADTALYSLAYTYGVLLNVFTNAIAEGWLPWFHDTYFAEKFQDIRKNVKPLIVLGCYIGLASIAFAPEAVFILGGAKYARSVNCVPPIVLGVVCQYVYTHYVNIELHLKKTMYVSGGTIFAAALNFGLNAIFIPKFGFIAAAYTTLASYFALMLVHFTITRKILHVKIYQDIFMFGALAVTAVISMVLMNLYDKTMIRYGVIAAGFASFLFYFRGYIKGYVRAWLRKHNKGKA